MYALAIKSSLSVMIIFAMTSLSCLVIAADFRQPDPAILGKWQTTLDEKGATLDMILEISSGESDSLECRYSLPEFGFYDMPYGKFVLKDNSFTLPGFSASYHASEEKISGIFTAFGIELFIHLKKVPKPPHYEFDSPEKEPDWSFQTGAAIWSSPTIADVQLVIGNDAGNLYNINLEERSIAWVFKCNDVIRSKAVIDSKAVYVTSDDGYLYSIDLKSGMENWKTLIGNNHAKRMVPAKEEYSYDYLASSPVLYNGIIYVGSMDHHVYALDAEAGSILWKFKTGGMVRSTPLLHNGIVYVGSWDHYMYALDSSNGNMIWNYDAVAAIQSSPAFIDNKLVFGSRSGFVFALDLRSGSELWKIRYWGSWVESSPVVFNGNIYIGSSDYRKVHAIDPDEGEVIWGERVEGWAWQTPAVNEKYVFCGSVGTLYYTKNMHGRFYKLDRTNGQPVWQVLIDDDENTYCYGFASSPTIYEDWVFIGGLDGKIYGIEY